MRFRGLHLLLLVLTALVVVTLLYRMGKRPPEARRLLAGFGHVEKIILAKGDSTVILVLSGEEWRIVSPIQASANQKAVGEFVEGLAKIELGEVVTTRPETYAGFGVDNERGGRILLQSSSDTVSFIIGKPSGSDEGYLRLGAEDAVYLGSNVTGRLAARGLDRWRDRLILAVPKSGIEQIEFVYSSRKHLLRREEGKWVFDGAEVDSSKLSPIFAGLENLQADGFLYEDGFEPEMSIVLALRDGRQERISIGEPDEGRCPVAREGDETVFLVSSWKIDRLKNAQDLN